MQPNLPGRKTAARTAPDYTSTVTTPRSMTPFPLSRRALLLGSPLVAAAALRCRSAAAQSGPFPLVVDLPWLANRASSPGLRLFDVSPLHIWKNGHIDSADHAWWRDTVDPNYPVFGAVLTQGDDEAHRQQVLDSLDLSTVDDVVVYDNESGFRAARLVWFLRFLGFERAALLNAGYDDWQAQSFSISSSSAIGDMPTVAPQPGYYVVTTQLLDRLGNPDLQLVDIRTDEERADDLDGNMPLGQIPGSIRLAWDRLLDDGHLSSANNLLLLAEDAGLNPSNPTVLYGSFGVDTALPWLALTAAGFSDLQTYDRGWAEWSITPDLPRESLR
jgi:thiosulfate/3-mercaptopyruvate sulfurtransferase